MIKDDQTPLSISLSMKSSKEAIKSIGDLFECILDWVVRGNCSFVYRSTEQHNMV